ncbi:THO complex subunit 5B-like isoform X1 [Tripterygium wilfordii]|uniref:THO complex subunit 5B-like isoform X1 n=1 Tax=Tripterygium wilfordii TaxID=458696 RepID=A0A7J7DKZ7_TRIWF|nr:THO complex subunit 5B-like [Tripterygium wilfordii]KAF5747042.1 THO complex subunit 5B-like isoform X1 [Tripterygium wilfordii]
MEDGEIEEGMLEEEDAQVPQEHHPKTEKSPYEMLKESKTAVEEIVAKMLSIKKEGQSKSLLRELVTQMCLHFVTLRQANRSILLEEDRVKAETERAKGPVDFTTLQLQNLMYEKSHYVKAIKACKDFKSKYPDIELVPEEEFLRDAPEHIKGPEPASDTSHNLMLKRLNYELHQRKELCKLGEKLEQRKKGLLETIANRKKYLSSLPSHLKSLKKASLPVQNQLGILHSKKIKQHQSAELLPPPLYVVYSQFLAQKEAFGENIDLEIVGSVKDAQAFARQQANKETGISINIENSRLDDDAADEEDDGQRRRKRPKKVPSKDNLDQAGVYQVHPLKVILHIYDDEASDPKSANLICLKFEYLLKLNVVCVEIEGSTEGPENNILCNLFPDDTGHELPNQSAKLLFGDAMVFDEKRLSLPYKWAQHLAGIDFLPEVSPLLIEHETRNSEAAKSDSVVSGLSLYRQQNRVLTVLQRIRSRKKAHLVLVGQLDSLLKLKWPSLNYGSVPWALHSPLCNLHGWSAAGLATSGASSLPVIDTEQVQEPIDVNMDGKSGTRNNESESAREDGELPSLLPVASVGRNDKLTSSKLSNLEHSRQLSLISKNVISPLSKAKSPSFRKHDDLDLWLDTDSEVDEPTHVEPGTENAASIRCYEMVQESWVDYGVEEYYLVLSRKLDFNERNVSLEAKVKISKEYPLRPPLFAVSFHASGENSCESDGSEYNELRAMEAMVNLHILKILPEDEENFVLAHQVRCLAMLFDYYVDKASQPLEKRKSTSVIDIGLCEPVNGSLMARSVRGRDRRKMISWKDMECTPGFPY